jgi:universal stress protein A
LKFGFDSLGYRLVRPIPSMKTILVPVDFSPATRHVVSAAVNLARSLGARLVLLHSVQPPLITTDYGVGLDMLQNLVELNEKTARQQLEHLQSSLLREGANCSIVLTGGGAAHEIIEQAKKDQADYIVLGSHGHTAVYDLLVGSTTHAVLKKAHCPVIIVPPAHKA